MWQWCTTLHKTIFGPEESYAFLNFFSFTMNVSCMQGDRAAAILAVSCSAQSNGLHFHTTPLFQFHLSATSQMFHSRPSFLSHFHKDTSQFFQCLPAVHSIEMFETLSYCAIFAIFGDQSADLLNFQRNPVQIYEFLRWHVDLFSSLTCFTEQTPIA